MMMSLRKSASETSWSASAGLRVAVVPDLVGPLLEVDVVGDAALQGDGVVLGAARRFPAAARVAAVAVLHHLGGALERADLADARHVLSPSHFTRNLKFLYGSKRVELTGN